MDEGIVQAAAKAVDVLSPRLHQWWFPADAGNHNLASLGISLRKLAQTPQFHRLPKSAQHL